jgi:hypothetical protein
MREGESGFQTEPYFHPQCVLRQYICYALVVFLAFFDIYRSHISTEEVIFALIHFTQ